MKKIKDSELDDLLNRLCDHDQEDVQRVWNIYRNSDDFKGNIILDGILRISKSHQLSHLKHQSILMLKIDFSTMFPPEICLRILAFCDAKSLCRSSQVSKGWGKMANDDWIWHRMCNQHIDRKCNDCGRV